MHDEFKKERIPADTVRKTITLPYMKFWNTHFPDLTKERQDRLYEHFIHQVDEPGLYPNSADVIRKLHKLGHKLFIVSSDPPTKLIPQIEKNNLQDYFIDVIGNVHEKEFAIKSLIKKHNLDPKNTLYIGDTSGDIEAAKLAGVISVGITWGFQDSEILKASKPDHIIDDIEEVLNLL